MEKKSFYTILLVLYVVLIIALAATPLTGKLGSITQNDKLLHFLEFFVLALLMAKAFSFYFQMNYDYILTIMFGLVAAYASEAVQLLVAVRTFSYRDLVADFFGIIVGTALVAALHYYQDTDKKRQAT